MAGGVARNANGTEHNLTDTPPNKALTQLLQVAGQQQQASEAELLSLLYDELRKIAGGMLRDERGDHTLQATALVHEAWARMIDIKDLDPVGRDAARRRFIALAARSMRRVLIDHARRRSRDKRGGDRKRVTLGDEMVAPEIRSADLLDIEEALQQIETQSPRLAQVAELRLFGGLDRRDIADTLGVSLTVATDEWALAKALLSQRLSQTSE